MKTDLESRKKLKMIVRKRPAITLKFEHKVEYKDELEYQDEYEDRSTFEEVEDGSKEKSSDYVVDEKENPIEARKDLRYFSGLG